MLLRPDGRDHIAISQPHHAWISGELARAWGGRGFAVPHPREAVVCAAAIHDIGWLEWERVPRLDPVTGLPLQFPGVRAEEHTKLWRRGVEQAAVFGMLPALIVSRHGDSIYERFFDPVKAGPAGAAAVRDFMEGQATFQKAVIAHLARDSATAEAVGDAQLAFTKRFIVAVDLLSLHLCWGIERTVTIGDVPRSLETSTDLTLTARTDHEILVAPWPFDRDSVGISIEGRRLEGAFQDQADLDRALHGASPAYLSMILRPA